MADVGIKITAVDQASSVFGKVAAEAMSLKDAVAATGSGFMAMAGTVGAALGAMSFAGKIKDAIDLADSFNKLSQKTGVSVQELSKLNYAAGLADVSTESLATGIKKLNVNISAAATGSKQQAEIFKALGISVKDAAGNALSADKVMGSLAEAFANSADGANKTAVAVALLGKNGADLIPLLNAGADGLSTMGDEAKKLGIVMGADFAKNAEEFNDNLHKMSLAGQGLVITFGSELVRALGESATAMANAAIEGGKLAGIVAGVQTFLTGTDQYKNDKDLVQQTEQLMALEKSMQTARASGNTLYLASDQAEIASLKQKIATTLGYRKVLQDLEEDKKKAEKPKPTQDSATIKKAAAAIHAPATGGPEKDRGNAFAGEQEAAKEWAKVLEAAGKETDELIAKNLDLSKSESALKVYMESAAAAINEKTNPAMNDMVRAALEANIALEAMAKLADTIKAQQKRAAAAQDETAKERERVDAIGLTTAAIAELTAAQLEDMAAAKERALVAANEIDLSGTYSEAIKAEVAALRERAGLVRTGAVKEAAVEAAKAAADEWKRGWESTDQLAREVFTDWATSGGNAAQKIGDTLKKALLSAIYEATLKPLVFQIFASVMGGTASTAAQALSSGGSTASGIANIFGGAGSLFGQGFRAGLGSVFGESGIMGGLSAGTTAIGAGNLMGGVGTLAGVAAPFLAGIASISALARAMDYHITPNGGAIVANVSSRGASAVANRTDSIQTGGLFGGGTTRNSAWANADSATTQYIDQNVKAVTAANKAYAKAIGLNADAVDAYAAQLDINTTGMDAAAAKAAVDAAIQKFAADQAQAAFGDAIAAFAKDGETASQTLARLGTDLMTVNDWARAFGLAMVDVSVQGAAAAATLIDAFGGLDQFNAQMSSFYSNYFTQAEQDARAYAAVQEDLSRQGFAISMEDLRSANKETIRAWVFAAQEMYRLGIITAEQMAHIVADANLLAPAVDRNNATNQAAIDAAKRAEEDAARERERQAQEAQRASEAAAAEARRAAEEYANALKAAQDYISGIARNINQFLASLDAKAETLQSYTRAAADFSVQMLLAKGGDRNALDNITGTASSLIDVIRRESSSAAEANLRIGRVRGQLAGLPGQLSPEQFIAQAIKDAGAGTVTAINTAATASTNNIASLERETKRGSDSMLLTSDAVGSIQLDGLKFNPEDPLYAIWQAVKVAAEASASIWDRVTNGTLGAYVSLSQNQNATALYALGSNYWRAASEWGAAAPKVFVSNLPATPSANPSELAPLVPLQPSTPPGWVSGYGDGTASQEALVAEVRALRADNQAQALSLVQLQQRMTKLMERWDGNGLPETRVVA